MIVSKNIPLDADKIVNEITHRQQAPWSDGRINKYNEYPTLQKLFDLINSGIPEEDFFYRGDLFRLHTPVVTLSTNVDPQREQIIGKISCDGSCSVLPITEYSYKLVSYSKTFDFTDTTVFNKVRPNKKAILLHINTQSLFGIDVNKLLNRYGKVNRYENEQEVLFPLEEMFVIKEYKGTPNKFKYYLRNSTQRNDCYIYT